jgi:hypothetical protein
VITFIYQIQNDAANPVTVNEVRIFYLHISYTIWVVLYECELGLFILRQEHTLKVFENRELMKVFGCKRE